MMSSTVKQGKMKIMSFLIVILFLMPLTSLLAGNDPFISPKRPGVVVFKVYADYQTELPAEGSYAYGLPQFDDFMNDIGAYQVERSYPFCLPPKPGGADLTRIYDMYFPEEMDINQVIAGLQKVEGVEYAEPWLINTIFLDHNDPRRDDQYALDLLEANAAHDLSTGDPGVVIAITDNGTKIDHADLAANIWVNPGEDLNGNGEIDNNERNNRDDDGNGRADDFYGWDFPGNDNDPMDDPNHGHGTHTAGIASAVTNNEIGIASVAYSCKLMIVRAGVGVQITHGYRAIEYAASNGASVINCSWGGYQITADDRDVLQYAYDNDVLVVASAGNNNTDRRSYPAAFEHNVAVSATNSRDGKANFSNYGDWVDIAAPGVDILSTMVNGNYTEMSGTSMSGPYVASVAALIRSYFPELNAEATRLYLLNGVNQIEDQRLGAGRVNAYRSLQAIDNPIMEMGDFTLDRDENGNNRVDPGERVEFVTTLSNFGHVAEDIVVVLSCEDEAVTIIDGEIMFPDIGTGEQATNDQTPFVFDVEEGTIPHTTTFSLQLTAQPNDISIHRDYDVLVGHPAVLIIDDDDGGMYEDIYAEAVRDLNLGYLHWDMLEKEHLTWETLNDYRIVLWETGNSLYPLNSDERWAMEIALREGANIMLSGKYIGNMRENWEFLRTSFGVYHWADSVTATTAIGKPGENPIIPPDLVIQLNNPDLGENDTLNAQISPSGSGVRHGADTLMVYIQADTLAGVAGVSWLQEETGSHTAYLGFNLDMASDYQSPRSRIVANIIDWMFDYSAAPESRKAVPEGFLLNPAYPNPFNSTISLNYNLPFSTLHRLSIIDITGRELVALRDGVETAGEHIVKWNAENIPSGSYLVKLSAPGQSSVEQRLVLLK